MTKHTSILSRHPVLDKFCELLIALLIVGGTVAAAFFFAAHEGAWWMPPRDVRRQIGWSIMGFGFGALYLYLALSTRGLEQKISNMPQLRQLLGLGQRWFVSLGISGAFFLLGLASLWPIIQRYKATLPTIQKWSLPTAGFQILTGLLCMLWGARFMKLRLHFRSWNSPASKHRLEYKIAFSGIVVYGALLFCSGLWLLLK